METHRGLRLLSPCRMARLPTTFLAGAKSLEDRSRAHLQSGRVVGAVGGGKAVLTLRRDKGTSWRKQDPTRTWEDGLVLGTVKREGRPWGREQQGQRRGSRMRQDVSRSPKCLAWLLVL